MGAGSGWVAWRSPVVQSWVGPGGPVGGPSGCVGPGVAQHTQLCFSHSEICKQLLAFPVTEVHLWVLARVRPEVSSWCLGCNAGDAHLLRGSPIVYGQVGDTPSIHWGGPAGSFSCMVHLASAP